MATTTAISSNPQRNDGGSILHGGNNDGTNITNTPTLITNANSNPVSSGINFQLAFKDEFNRAVIGTNWGSGLPNDAAWGIVNLNGASGLRNDDFNIVGGQGDELLYLGHAVSNRYKLKTLYEWADSSDDIPGSIGFVARVNSSGFIHVYNRQSQLLGGRLQAITYTWNGVTCKKCLDKRG